MTRDRDEEQMGFIRIVSAEATLSNVLEEIPLAGVLPSELPGRLIERLGVAIRVYVNLEIPLHLGVVQPKNLRRVIDAGELLLRFPTLGREKDVGRRGRGEGVEGIEGEVGEGA